MDPVFSIEPFEAEKLSLLIGGITWQYNKTVNGCIEKYERWWVTQEVPQVALFMHEGALLSESYPAGGPRRPRPGAHGHFCCHLLGRQDEPETLPWHVASACHNKAKKTVKEKMDHSCANGEGDDCKHGAGRYKQ